MKKTAVIYWSGTGNTEAMANAVAEGMRQAGAECSVLMSADVTADTVAALEAVALGCPAMGAEELEETEFAPMFDGIKSALTGKAVALFGSYGWGDGEWMRTWEEDCADDTKKTLWYNRIVPQWVAKPGMNAEYCPNDC